MKAKIYYCFLLSVSLFSFELKAQADSLYNEITFSELESNEIYFDEHYRSYGSARKQSWVFGAGLSYGQETILGIPKLGIYRDFSLIHQKKPSRFGFGKCSVHAGGEMSLFVLFAGVFSFSANTGMSFGPVTLDQSLTYTTIIDPSGQRQSDYGTYNPKLGLSIGPVWLKAGPSFVISGHPQSNLDSWYKRNGIAYNIELCFLSRF